MDSQSRLHVTIASTQSLWHGGEKQAALLAEGIQRHGHRCTILARDGGEFARRLQGNLDVRTFSNRGRSPRALRDIRRTLRELKPDVLHSNDAHALTAVGVAGLGLRIPVRVVARRVDFPLRSVSRYRLLANGLICVSTSVAGICAAAGIPESNLHVVHDGVEPAFAESGISEVGRESLELAENDRLLLTVAKLTDHKGHRYLLEAMPQLLRRHPKALLALAGDGELRSDLEAQARRLGVENRIRFLGYRRDVAHLLAAADVVVQPSHMEGLCSSLIDAMLAAKPIVATRAGGIPDLLGSRSNEPAVAWQIPTKSPEAICDAVDAVLRDPETARHRGALARERALERFTAEQMVERTLTVYARIASQLNRGHAALASLFSEVKRSAA